MKRLFAVSIALAIACLIPAGASAAPTASDAGLKLLSAKAVKSGKGVQVRVRWDMKTRGAAKANKRFVLRILAHGERSRKSQLGSLRTSTFGKAGTETVTVKTNARLLRKAKRVTATATQQYDNPKDNDNRFERNVVAIRAVAGKGKGLKLRGCATTLITPGSSHKGCSLYGAHLANAYLQGVNLQGANLERGSLAGANLKTTNLKSANLIGTDLKGALWPEAEQSSLTFPDQGKQILDLIASAQTSVDIVIFDFGGPNLVGQPSDPGALMEAVQRGVNVRVILNSGQNCADTSPPQQSICAGKVGLDPLYATQAALEWAKNNPAPGKTAGKYRVQFSSENYQITHQKSILIDTSNPDGTARTADQMTSNSKIMVSTGNLQAYPVDWGLYNKCAQWHNPQKQDYCIQWEVINPSYLSNPAATCEDGTPATCKKEWAARDFAIEVTDPTLMERIAAVFAADQTCKNWNEAPIYQQLINSNLPDTWANGTLLLDGSGYPPMGSGVPVDQDPFYGGSPNKFLQTQPQGNSRERQLAVIASATKSLRVYNEEMKDPDIANALVAAAQKGVDVRVVMSAAFANGTPAQNPYYDFLTKYGVEVKLLDKDSPNGEIYIHAKAIVADGTDAFMGSENFGYSSMNYNRELGLMLTNDPSPTSEWLPSTQGIAAIINSFDLRDWVDPKAVSYSYSGKAVPAFPPGIAPLKAYGAFPGANMLCLDPAPGDLYLPGLPNRTTPTG
ncbi:MAG: phospholipase D-like domain-containing protein [Solirubrobacterales bacterium]